MIRFNGHQASVVIFGDYTGFESEESEICIGMKIPGGIKSDLIIRPIHPCYSLIHMSLLEHGRNQYPLVIMAEAMWDDEAGAYVAVNSVAFVSKLELREDYVKITI